MASGGEPGGDRGISRFGTDGKVSSCRRARLDEYGEEGAESRFTVPSSCGKGSDDGNDGPKGTGPMAGSEDRLCVACSSDGLCVGEAKNVIKSVRWIRIR